jgi:hypothetical protein
MNYAIRKSGTADGVTDKCIVEGRGIKVQIPECSEALFRSMPPTESTPN